MMSNKYLQEAMKLQEKMVGWRRDFHMHPELGFNEVRTSGKIVEALNKLGFTVRTKVGKTGVTADLGTGNPVIALRADMDALPLQEKNEVDYVSQSPGLMHACGHDAHTAMLLGVAEMLAKEEFPGIVRLIFQPSEERADEEGVSGAPRMVQDGAMEGVDLVIALHVAPGTPTGKIRVEPGPASGGVDSWFGRIIGKGGHGAYPNKALDPFYICSHVIIALNGIVSRRIAPFSPAVVSIGTLHGGQIENVIPESVSITGTIRYTETEVQQEIHKEIRRAFELARTLGGEYELKFEIGDPPMINSAIAVDLIKSVSEDIIGTENILPMTKDLGAEDFGVFSKIAPGAMFVLGAMLENDERTGHNPYFDIDERCLPIGAAIMTAAALKFLRK